MVRRRGFIAGLGGPAAASAFGRAQHMRSRASGVSVYKQTQEAEYEGEKILFIGDCGGSGYDPRVGARRGATVWGSKQRCAKHCIHSGFLRHVGAPIPKRLRTAVIGSRSSEEQGARERPASWRQ